MRIIRPAISIPIFPPMIPMQKRAPNAFHAHAGTAVIIAVSVGLYAIATDFTKSLDPVLFPGVATIARTLVASMPKLLECLGSSMLLLIPGCLLGGLFGIGLGVVIALHPSLLKACRPVIFSLAPIPPSMLTPYFIAVMSTFYEASLSILFLGVFWPTLAGTIDGISLIDSKYLDNARVLELKGFKKLFLVILPAASPMILSGVQTGLNFAFILLTVAEMFATNSGLGYFVQYYADFSDYARVIAGILFTAFVFVIIMAAFERMKKRLLFWCR